MNGNNHRILLIEPPFYRLFKETYSLDRYPLSLGYLAGTIKKETDWDVMAYNSDFSPQGEIMKTVYLTGAGFENYLKNLKELSGNIWREIRSAIDDYNPTVVGISAKTQNFAAACIIAKLAKDINRQIIVVVGGPHPSTVGPKALGCPYIDAAVKGEGENTIVELLNAIKMGRKFDNIKGVIYREGDSVIENPTREFISNLDSLCFPHEYADKILKGYERYPRDAFGYIFGTRGCPHNCFFCGSRYIWNRKARFRSPANIVSEIKALQNKGLHSINFADDIFGITSKYIRQLCDSLISNCPGLKWTCEIHVSLVNEQNISIMKKAGCYSIRIGIESGNNEILKEIRKGYTIEQAFRAVDLIKKYGIESKAFFMVGFPQETLETLKDTMTAIKNIRSNDLIFSIFTPYPGTEAFEYCKTKGLIGEDFDISMYNHLSPVNYFCPNISREAFRAAVLKIEKIVDRRNLYERIKGAFSAKRIWRLKELGISETLKRGLRIFLK